MSRTPTTRTPTTRTPKIRRWIHRSHRHHWLADTRDENYAAGRMMRGYDRPS